MEKRYSINQARHKLIALVRKVVHRLVRRKRRIDWGRTLVDTRGFKFDREQANARR